jgi:hypothetical protein
MKTKSLLFGLLLFAAQTRCAIAEEGFTSMFNGHDLMGWEGATELWSVKDGVIVGQTTKENPAKENTFLVWKGGEPSDFEMKCQFRIAANNDVGFANSGVQFRSRVVKPSYWVVSGYQADMEAGPHYTGGLYEEKARGILASRGEKILIHADGKKEVVGKLGDSAALENEIRKGDWNDYDIIAKGNHIQLFINQKQMVDVVDEQTEKAATSGIIALQLHAGQPMTVEFKDLRIKDLK